MSETPSEFCFIYDFKSWSKVIIITSKKLVDESGLASKFETPCICDVRKCNYIYNYNYNENNLSIARIALIYNSRTTRYKVLTRYPVCYFLVSSICSRADSISKGYTEDAA